ncbi:MAG: nuclear transport factor 2 family protein [Thermomonas sp.]
MHPLNRIGTLLLLSGLAVCSVGVATAAEPEISAADCFTLAFKAGNADAVAACYAEDGVIWFPGGPMAKGRKAIRDGFAGYFSSVSIKDISMTALGEEAFGDTKASWGSYLITVVDKASGTEMVQRGRYTDVTKRIDGRWLYVADHPSDDPPAAHAAAQ